MNDRFEAKINRIPGGCHIWQAAKNSMGYGHFNVGNRKYKLAHRISYELANGPIPEGKIILHDCDTPACVNPQHLTLGTHANNSHDMAKRGRARGGPMRRLSSSNERLISPEDIPLIRLSKLTCAEEGRRRGVSDVTISNIRNRKTWRGIP